MQEAADRWEKRRLLPREVAGTQQDALRESIELKYQMRLLFKLLGKQDESVRGVCDDDAWVMQQFTEMLHVPRYALIKRCPRGDDEKFRFHPLIYEEKVYSNVQNFNNQIDIRVTNCNDDSLITTLTGHTRPVQCLIMDDDKLYSGSQDYTIKIWNCSTDTLIETLTEHTGIVTCLTISDGKLYSGSNDRSIKVWNCSNFELITTLGVSEDEDEGHTSIVDCLTVNDGKLYSGSADKTIKVWDCSTNKLITTLTEHTGSVQHLLIHGGKLFSKSWRTFKIHDCSDNTLILRTPPQEEPAGFIRCLAIHNDKLYTGSADNMIRVYDCSDGTLITTLIGHHADVYDLTFQNGKLYSKQSGGDIYIWQL